MNSSSAPHARLDAVLPSLFFLLFFGLFGGAALWRHHDLQSEAQTQIEHHIGRLSDEVVRRFHHAEAGLNSVNGLYAANEKVTRAEFQAFVGARHLPTEFPGVRGFGFIKRVVRPDLDTFVAAARADGAPQFTPHRLSDTARDELLIVEYIEPAANNHGAMGQDISSEPSHRSAAQRAIDSGEATMSVPAGLVRDERTTMGPLLMVPFYAKGTHPSTVIERRRSLVGLLYAPLAIEELLHGMPEIASGLMDIEVADRTPGTTPALIYDSDKHGAAAEALLAPDVNHLFSSHKSLSLLGRELSVRFNSEPKFDATVDRSTPWLILVAGIVISAILALYLRNRLRQFVIVTTLVERRTVELNRERLRLQTILQTASDGIHILDTNGLLVEANLAFLEMLGLDDSVIGKLRLSDWDPRSDSGNFQMHIDELIKTQSTILMEREHRRRDGSLIDVEVSAHGILVDGQRLIYCASRDISERKGSEEKLLRAASVFDHALEGIMITALDGRIIDVNDAFSQITGYSRDEVIGQNPRILNSSRHDKAYFENMLSTLIESGTWIGENWNRRKNGDLYAQLQKISTVRDEQGIAQQYVSLFSDITIAKNHGTELERIAHYDNLTNLPNRALLAERMNRALLQAERGGQHLAVVFLDLDGFKLVNDTHGHDAGDHVLITVARRMKEALREGDILARLGGDEFVLVLLNLADVDASAEILNRLLTAAARPVQLGQAVIEVSASLGVTFYPQSLEPAQEMDADQLLRQADQAMYQAKQSGKNRFCIFDAEQDRSVRKRHESMKSIRRALAENELVLEFQPKVNLRTASVIGAEALIRWLHPQRGVLPPADFLPMIEDHPLAIDLGWWVIENTLLQIERWQEGGLSIQISVNIGRRHLMQADFVQRLCEILAAHPQLKPNCLQFELMEASAIEDQARVVQVIQACRGIGVEWVLDDFGSGHSSLTCLKMLPVKYLKIEQSFIRDMLDHSDSLLILIGILKLASAFELKVIAEGVETVQHGYVLLQLGCDLAQGYGIARPMPADELPGWVRSWTPDPTWGDLMRA